MKDKVKILVVDDRPANLLSMKAIFADRDDYDLIAAGSGEEALAAVLREDFACILLDVAMPGMDGFETARLLKQRERSSRIPIIFITASVYDMQHVYRGYTVGAVDYLKKPIEPQAVRAKVATFVELHRQAREIARQAELLRQKEARTREALDASETRFLRLRESGLIGVCYFREDGAITDANEAFLKMIGQDAGRLAAGEVNWREMTPPEWDAADAHALEELRSSGVTGVYEKEFVCADGHRVSVLVGSAAFGDHEGVAFAVDITARRRVEEERARLIRELRVALRARDEFLSIAAHELKTPLTPLRVQTEGLLRALKKPEGVPAEKLVDRLQRIDRSARRLERLIENLLDFSRVAAGRLELRQEETDLARLTAEVVERLREAADRAGSSVALSTNGPVRGLWDVLRMEQVIENILGNAIKYGSGQPIEIEVAADGESALFRVTDHGIGIPKESQGRIFERFERVAPVEHFGGFGLGLWIVRQIVEAHGGTIAVESDGGGQGAVFTVRLPQAAVDGRPLEH
jgi:PAS domain S-box-containing protein